MPTSKQKSLNSKNKFFVIFSIIFLTLCFAAVASGYLLYSSNTAHIKSSSSITLSEQLSNHGAFIFPRPITVTDVPFINEEGQTVTKENNLGKWSFIFFGYTFCPDICPTTLAVMQQMWVNLSSEDQTKTQIVLVSVDIERDTPEQLKTYMDYFDPSFTAFTGNASSLQSFTTQLNAVYAKVERLNEAGGVDPELGYLMDHSANIAILDPNGNYFGFIKPPFSPNTMLSIVNAIHTEKKP
jgi:protein SCO1/2